MGEGLLFQTGSRPGEVFLFGHLSKDLKEVRAIAKQILRRRASQEGGQARAKGWRPAIAINATIATDSVFGLGRADFEV